ncbi:hypothetical protein O7635_14050 [Asanoa sp. WMMD1127]|uniref:hypothetical protein n=1 Tax=Asanoa sp. WMMD1127 TaxID=3016107 RepID=UPI002415D0E0|nr:hypothetical protein [Asanoa sp. WMMD1127]MDG4822972.1 hypothetical protein [Asanoa sp. WMMD1127]
MDYTDEFSLATTAEATPEQWARAMFGDVPSLGEIFIWRVVLGLRLRPERSPETVAGWVIDARGDDWIRLVADSWLISANLVVHARAGSVSLTTIVRYAHRVAQLAWPPLSTVHRGLVPRVLRAADARIRARQPVAPDGRQPARR